MKIFLLLLFFLLSVDCEAQLTIDTTYATSYLINTIFVGDGIKVGPIKNVTNKSSIGYYKCADNKIGLKTGVLIASGLATNAIGPNNSPGASSTWSNYGKKIKGDRSLSKLTKGLKTYDVSVIEFDFVPLFNKVMFEYSFGSEEYKEYVGSKFNDVFGFFITGPGMNQKNVALLPQDKNFVAINNINHKTNEHYFIDNDPFINNTLLKGVAFKPRLTFGQLLCRIFSKKHKQNDSVLFYTNRLKKQFLDEKLLATFQYDAFTRKMKVVFFAVPYHKYHLKIAIADVGDASFDSGVFLEEKSFIAINDSLDPKYHTYAKIKILNTDSILGLKRINSYPIAEAEINSELFENTLINFDTDSYAIPDSCKIKLNKLVIFIQSYPQFKLNITGYTDNTGISIKNKALSEKRATVVTQYLTEKGINSNRIAYLGFSDENPVGNNQIDKGRALNRRVEIELED